MKLIEMKNHFYMKGFRPLRITACGGCGGWPHGCGSSLNPGWKEIGFGCGQTYYRYTGCGSPRCGGPLPNSCG